jgi:lipopolysaccharide/colanic/teichoic acid biosynthesis glycosyltransferase
MIRRVVDVTAAIVGLVLLSPVFVVIAVWVSLESPGGAFYGGPRVGKDGRLFRMWKFRTMARGSDRLGGITTPNDSRITRIGAYLRRTKLDELPQLFNLLTGDLTLVGPRAEVPEFVARYTPEQREILAVKPGITGPGQIYYTTDQADSIPPGVAADEYYVEHLLGPKLEMDLDYLRHRTPFAELRVVFATFGLLWHAFTGRSSRPAAVAAAREGTLPLR